MRKLSFVLLALVGTMILGLPLQSYADSQLGILLNIATQARDNLGVTISQTNNVSDEINQLYKQGSDETDQLATAVNQQDSTAAKQHFLAAMKFFKETNDKINSLNATALNDQQKVEIAQLRGEITRLDNMENLLKNIATTNNIQIDFTKFDALIQTAQQDLDSGNVNDAITSIKNANDFLVETHNSLTAIATERDSERAKDFTERQIERFSKMNGFNTTVTNTTSSTIPPPPPISPPPIPENTTVTNTTSSTIPPPPTISPPPISPPPIPENTTVTNTTSSNTIQQSAIQNNVNPVVGQNPEEMLAELKKLVSEGKVNEALKIIKMIEAYQNGKLKMPEKMEQLQSSTTSPNVTENSNSSTTTTHQPPISPPPQPTTHGGNEKNNLEKNKHDINPHQGNDHQNSNGQD